MNLTEFRPRSQLVTRTTLVDKPRFPVFDAHNHLGGMFGGAWDEKPLPELLDRLDQAGVEKYIDLDGGWGEEILQAHLDHFKQKAPERFKIFGGVDWGKWPELGDSFPEYAARRLAAQKSWGAEGLKIWKNFGLQVRDHHGELVRVNDPRLDPVWQAAAEAGLPVLAHVADPVAFFDPIDETNERWEELARYPEWAFTSPPFPPFMQILNDFKALVSRHPSTLFIGAHVGCYAENLAWVSGMLDSCPNYFVDISARIGELGRQPYTARRFFLQYQDRILFGLDSGPDPQAYSLAYRFLESDDEYFNYDTSDIPGQGRWYAYGIFLPPEVLEKVYWKNAEKLMNKTQS